MTQAVFQEQSRLALAEAPRWDPEVLEPAYLRFFEEVAAGVRRP